MKERSILPISAILLGLLFSCAWAPSLVEGQDAGFRPLFDGKTLEGWSAPDPRYWSVEDGAITARSTAETPCTQNQFLTWALGEVDDFELELSFRIRGTQEANSGVQIRSAIHPDGHAEGYQADIDLAGQWLGALYDEHTERRLLAARGQRTHVFEGGFRTTEALPQDDFRFDSQGWNRYRVVARGSRITLSINGVVTADVIDQDSASRDLSGRLALQLHSGPPTLVQFKDLRLKRLPLAGGRKKVVLVAGGPSHPPGQHEFNAGTRLLRRRLDRVPSVLAADYHDNGWPKDPSAFDNADAIVVYADGEGSHPIVGHFDQVDALMGRGVGLLCMHYAVHVAPGEQGGAFQRWIGGYYESGFSSNPHWDAALELHEGHPITRGAWTDMIRDEWYFSIRFREDESGVTPILRAKPSDEARAMNGWPRKPYPHIIAQSGRAETLLWAVERPDGGRGAGFTGGHWHRNWASETQRKVILNAMLWVAGAEVPEGGVASEPVSEEELNVGLDPKGDPVRVLLPGK